MSAPLRDTWRPLESIWWLLGALVIYERPTKKNLASPRGLSALVIYESWQCDPPKVLTYF